MRGRSALGLGLAAAILVSACEPWIGPKPTGDPLKVHGAGLVEWNSRLYVLGGVDASGAYRAEVWRAAVGADGVPSGWARDVDLPHPIAFAACVTFGGMIYAAGGRDAAGLRDEVYFNMINADGSLGFSSGWAANTRSLPEARSGAAPLIAGGRLFLVGGETTSGPQPTILSARFWNDGQVGQWYAAPQPLPASGPGFAVACSGGRVAVVGGGTESCYVSELDSRGLPGPWSTRTIGGGSALYPALASTAEGFVALGGSVGGGSYAPTRIGDVSSWSVLAPVQAFGPHFALVADNLFVTASIGGGAPPSLKSLAISTARADTPRVWPGDGVIRPNTSPRVVARPGDTVRYTTSDYGSKPSEPADPASAAWNPAAPFTVSASASYAFRSFRAGAAAPSEIVYVSYRVLAGSTFPMIKATIHPQAGTAAYTNYELTESYSNGSTAAVSAVWFQVEVASRSVLSLGWRDNTVDAQAYAASVKLSLFEDVAASTPARGVDGAELYDLIGGFPDPFLAELGPGSYYLKVESRDGSTGGSFGLRVAKGP